MIADGPVLNGRAFFERRTNKMFSRINFKATMC